MSSVSMKTQPRTPPRRRDSTDGHGISEQPERPIQFGPYLLENRLAKGGMAEILRGVSSGPHGFRKTVVVKRILHHRDLQANTPPSNRSFIESFNKTWRPG